SAGEPLAESWQVYAGNRIQNGAWRGRTLGELAGAAGAPLLGEEAVARYGTTVPLLAKFIDAAKPLSIQVHPNDRQAAEREPGSGQQGKSEAWYVLQAQPGAGLIRGFKHPVTELEIREAVAAGTLEDLLSTIKASPGQVIYNPAGLVHAIGGGILLFEIQQSSDITYRLYDYQRRDASGNLRELHLDKALAVADLTPARPTPTPAAGPGVSRRELLRTPYFVMEALTP